ncbi:peptidylprolyl isomerase [Enterococcus villorum]|uniref:Foldase protein PrsA n=2 Tax=Enterococcus villorum TaxID=112904 RepID=A0A511J1G1_9ENTE|nr:peptidylprolyl isomerase [Enterococcus villorum]EOH91406.1 hypothetical protein UAO_00739 [Enterococcus villorum ATCC 700913]EOW76784.1 hypothetical protein I591_02092 [Enterococcus villorum ATCC 700913]GEL91822.1 foldase protein PrsA [Enterococcus villorum]
MKKIVSMFILIIGTITLSACTSNSMEQSAITFKGGKFTEQDIFNKIKKSNDSKSILQSMIVNKVFVDKYGSKVTDKEIDEQYKQTKEQLGDSFDSQLQAAGMTKETLKERIKENLAYDKGLKAHVKITDADLKTAWKSFHPEVQVQMIKLSDEKEAKDVKEKADKGEDFSKLVKEKSTDEASKKADGKVKFDSQTTTIPTEVKEAAFKLKGNGISDVISSINSTSYAYDYYVVKMIKNQSKGDNLEKYKKELKEIATQTQMNNNEFINKTIDEELKAANVKIKDKDLTDVLQAYQTTDSSKTKASDTKTTDTKTSKTKLSDTKVSDTKTTNSSK